MQHDNVAIIDTSRRGIALEKINRLGNKIMSTKNKENNNGHIQRIYVTNGDGQLNSNGVATDRAAGLIIDGKVYWIANAFESLSELNNILNHIYVSIDDNGDWGIIDEDGDVTRDKSIVPLDMSHSLIFSKQSSFTGLAAKTDDGSIWWTMNELFLQHQCSWLRVCF